MVRLLLVRGAGSRTSSSAASGARVVCRDGRDAHTGAGRPLDAEVAFPVLADLHDRDVDHHFGPRLVEIVNELLGEEQFVRCAAHHQGTLALHAIDLDLGKDIAQSGLDVVEVVLLPGIGQVKRLDCLLVQLGSLGTSILRDEDGIGGNRAPEGVGHGPDDPQGVEQRNIG